MAGIALVAVSGLYTGRMHGLVPVLRGLQHRPRDWLLPGGWSEPIDHGQAEAVLIAARTLARQRQQQGLSARLVSGVAYRGDSFAAP